MNHRALPLSLILLGVLVASAVGAEPARVSLERRVPWTTNHLHGTPDPPDPYRTVDAYPRLKFVEPLSAGRVPGTRRLAVATRPGKIYTFEDRADCDQADLLVDVGRSVYGVAIHPRFAENRQFFVTSIVRPDDPRGSRLSRFTARIDDNGRPTADAADEQVVLEWPSGGHNGGCVRFGPDGMLYLSTGDGSGIADGLETGQNVSDLLGSLLRIDVDHADPGRGYSIPADNPLRDSPGARGEIWSFGHRQVWKFAFDNSGRLWAGEVGQDLWEMIYLIRRGGNYGWSVREGAHPFRPERRQGPGDFEQPIVEHPHSDFRSITGGYVFESSRQPELVGAYIYGDYDTGKLWSLRYEEGRVVEHRQLADTQIRIVEFLLDHDGDVLLVDFAGGGLHRIVPAPPPAPDAPPFPRKLSETGLFASTKDHQPAPGVIPYSVNAALYSDGAHKERLLALPGESQIEFDDVVYPHGPDYADPGWRFPDGAVLVKTFSIDLEPGNPASRRRLETRLLQYRLMPGDDDEYGAQVWSGYTYVWNDEQTDAELLDASGLDRTLVIRDPAAPEGRREQVWRFPSRAECTLCHTMASKYALGVSTLQMNRDHDYGDGQVANQLEALARLGMFKTPLPKPARELPRLVDYQDATAPLHLRARAYLHANCAHCHRKWGGGNAEFELQASVPLTQTGTVDTRPGQGAFDLDSPRIIAPGAPDRSLILHRMRLTGLGRMPHIASRVVDEEGVAVIREWLEGLAAPGEVDRPGAVNPR